MVIATYAIFFRLILAVSRSLFDTTFFKCKKSKRSIENLIEYKQGLITF